MSVNKNALIRYKALDRCFRNTGRRYRINDLLDACNDALAEEDPESSGIQVRQLYMDILFMESEQGWSIPLEKVKDGRMVYYRYSDPGFSINNQPLNQAEAEQLRAAVEVISRFSGTPEFEWVNELIPKIESRFGLVERKAPAIGFESNIDLRGLHHLKPLFQAIVNERVLRVMYKDFKSSEPYEVILHPAFLKEFNNRWFVLGYNGANQNPHWNLALDRIEGIEETGGKYKRSKTDWEDYFYDIIGVTHSEGAQPVEVRLHFTTEVSAYVITKPLHPTQKHRNTPEGLEVRIRVVPNYELESLILSYGEKVRVVSPASLKKRIAQRIMKAASQYGKTEK